MNYLGFNFSNWRQVNKWGKKVFLVQKSHYEYYLILHKFISRLFKKTSAEFSPPGLGRNRKVDLKLYIEMQRYKILKHILRQKYLT